MSLSFSQRPSKRTPTIKFNREYNSKEFASWLEDNFEFGNKYKQCFIDNEVDSSKFLEMDIAQLKNVSDNFSPQMNLKP